jgi:hypothetical protein
LAAVPGAAWSAPAGNTTCEEFCTGKAFRPGRQRGECTSLGARGEGPCYSCTVGVGPGPHFSPQCGPTEGFNPETCECFTVVGCPNPSEGGCSPDVPCEGGPNPCGCYRTTEGTGFCLYFGDCGKPCASSTECDPGQACVFSGCSCAEPGQAFCQDPCGWPYPF